jgi:hypothetical protein
VVRKSMKTIQNIIFILKEKEYKFWPKAKQFVMFVKNNGLFCIGKFVKNVIYITKVIFFSILNFPLNIYIK